MKQLPQIIFLVLLVILMHNCSNKKVTATLPSKTIALSGSEEGTIFIRSSGEGKTEADAVRTAERKAFNTLLFYGLPASLQTRPLIENESQTKSQHPSFFLNFFDKDEYKSFIVSSITSGNASKKGSYSYLERDIKINLRALRTHLENNGIIRKFGY